MKNINKNHVNQILSLTDIIFLNFSSILIILFGSLLTIKKEKEKSISFSKTKFRSSILFLGINIEETTIPLFLICFLLIFLIINNIKNKYFKDLLSIPMFISLVVIGFISLFSVLFPLFSYLFAVISIFSLVLIPLPNYAIFKYIKKKQYKFIDKFVFILVKTNLIKICYIFYLNIWCLPKKYFKNICLVLLTVNIIYIIVSRYYFINVVFSSTIDNTSFSTFNLVLISLMFFIGIFSIYFRFLLNLSLFLTQYILETNKSLILPEYLMLVDPLDASNHGSEIPPNLPKGNNQSKNQFVFFQKNNNNVKNIIPNVGLSKRFLVIGTLCSLCFVGGTFYYTRMQGLETMRQNDLSEVEQGFMTRDEYIKKWKKQ